jgi:hypothetical protein
MLVSTPYSLDYRMIVNVEQLVEGELRRETEVLGANPFQYHSVYHKWDGNPGGRGGELATNCLRYGTV